MTPLEKRIRECDRPRPSLLFQAWEAARAGDCSSFEAAFIKSLAQFVGVEGSGQTPIHWVATHQSVIALAAMRLGFNLPQLPPNLDALIMTRKSLELGGARVPNLNGTGGANLKPRMDRLGDGGELARTQISPECIVSLIKKFKAGRPKSETISSRQLTFTLRGLMMAKTLMGRKGKALNRATAEEWFTQNVSIESHFGDRNHFVRCLDIAIYIMVNEI